MGTTLSSLRWVVDPTNQIVSRDTTVTPTVIDVTNDLYSDLQDLFDDADFMDDPISMSAQTPTEYAVINQWFIDNESTKYLSGGAIQTIGFTAGANNYIRTIEYDASGGTMFVDADVGRTITGTTTTDAGIILDFDEDTTGSDTGTLWIRVTDPTPGGDEFDNGTEAYTVGASSAAGVFSAVSVTGESVWANVFTLGTLETNTRIYLYQTAAKLGSEAEGSFGGPLTWPALVGLNADGQLDLLVKIQEADSLIDDGFLIAFARQGGKLYDHFEPDVSAGGRNPIPLATGGDLNDAIGHHNVTWTAGSGATLVVGEVVDLDSDAETAAVVAVSSDTGGDGTGDFDYYLIRSLTQFVNTDAVTAVTSTKTMVLGTPTNLTPATDSGITWTWGAIDRDINNGFGPAPYHIDFDPNNVSFVRGYQRSKYLMRRGGIADIDTGAQTITGESYRGAVLQIEYSSQSGGDWTEGNVVYDQTSGAFGTISGDHDDGAAGDVILRDIRGTFQTGAANLGDAPTGPTVTADIDSIRNISSPKTAPLGTFAGGVFFLAPGVVPLLASILAGEENSYQCIDDDGTLQLPPLQVSISVTDLAAGDRVAVFRLTGAGGTIVKDEYDSHATLNAVGDQTLEVQTTVSTEAPTTGWVRIEYDTDLEDRYHFASYATSIFTLTTNGDWGGNTETAGDTTGLVLTDTTTPATFIADGVLPGMTVRNVTDGSKGTVKTVDSETVLTLERQLEGGTENDWDIADVYEINRLARTYDGADTVYIAFLDEINVAGGTSNTSIIYSGDINVSVEVRNSTDGAGTRWLPLSAPNTITATGMTQSGAKTEDTIAS